MKYTQLLAIAALFTTAHAEEELPEIEGVDHDEEMKTMWYVDGIKGFYDGYYKSFYKHSISGEMKECLNNETIGNMIRFHQVLTHPLDLFKPENFGNDFNLLTEGTQILTDLHECKFFETFGDIKAQCAEDPDKCAMGQITQNLSKNMFVLIGKLTSLAELFGNFPSQNNDEFADQMYELGDDAGTLLRSLFDFSDGNDVPEQHHYSHHERD